MDKDGNLDHTKPSVCPGALHYVIYCIRHEWKIIKILHIFGKSAIM